MRIALTADLHLAEKQQHPERYAALSNILEQLRALNINTLIVAGDLFDKAFSNYSDFDQVVSQPQYEAIQIVVVPGNHDPGLGQSSFVAANVRIIESPGILPICEDVNLFVMPYLVDKAMGEILEMHSSALSEKPWVLIGHGNYTRGLGAVNAYEPDEYMPVTSVDIERYSPRRTFLGHIHAPSDHGSVHLIGSPCGMDITETGQRRFLVYDTSTNQVTPHTVETELLFFNETLTIYPVADETAYIQHVIQERIASWAISESDYPKVQLRVTVNGVSADKRKLAADIETEFSDFKFYKDEKPDLSAVQDAGAVDFSFLVDRVKQKIETLAWQESDIEPGGDEILLAALQTIYGG